VRRRRPFSDGRDTDSFSTPQTVASRLWSDLVLALNMGYFAKELNVILTKAREQRALFLEAWRDHFAN